jgi:hypothetical protein
VLEPGAAPPPRRPQEPEDVLPPLAELPPMTEEDLALEGIQSEEMEVLEAAPLEPESGEPLSEEPPAEPADGAASEPAESEGGGGPVNIAP